MPRFEDLMDRHGRIRFRCPYHKWPIVLVNSYGAVCRGWQFVSSISEPDFERAQWLNTLQFRPTPIQRFDEADFDAMLSALEPYELVREADEPLEAR